MGYTLIEDDAPAKGSYTLLPDDPAITVGNSINSIPRQLGLTARYGLEGLANSAQLVTEPIRYITDRLTGSTGKTKPLGALATEAADWMGLPSPNTPTERVVGAASRLIAGTGAGIGVANQASQLPGLVGKTSVSLASNPVQQLSAAAGSGLAGESSKEAGGGGLAQFGASLLGGVTGGFASSAANSIANGSKVLANKLLSTGTTAADLDAKISVILSRSGVDYSEIPERVRQSLRQDMAGALQADKEFSPEAVARLLDFKKVGATPTRGMISQDPVQITKEMNLAKIGANSSDDSLHGLAQIQNQNNSRLIGVLNEAGAGRGDPFAAGQSAINAITGKDQAAKGVVSSLYGVAKDLPGGTTQLDRKTLVDNIYGNLTKENKLAFLPAEVSNMIDTISAGQVTRNGQTFQVHFDANALDNLMTTIANAPKKDGNVKRALSLVRDAIDKTPITPLKDAYGGNQLVTQATAAGMRAADEQAPAFMDALNAARKAHAERMAWQESSKPIEAAIGGIEPDNFIKKFVLNGSLSDAESIAKTAGVDAAKDAILKHLKDKAISNAQDGYGKFSQSAYRNALEQIGDRKLSVFFTPKELSQLRSVSNVASAMQVQPVGSAVNNSNSGALLVGKAYDALKAGIGMVPGAGPITAGLLDLTLGNPTKNAATWLNQRNAQNYIPGLLRPGKENIPMYQNMLIPALAAGGLLSAP